MPNRSADEKINDAATLTLPEAGGLGPLDFFDDFGALGYAVTNAERSGVPVLAGTFPLDDAFSFCSYEAVTFGHPQSLTKCELVDVLHSAAEPPPGAVALDGKGSSKVRR